MSNHTQFNLCGCEFAQFAVCPNCKESIIVPVYILIPFNDNQNGPTHPNQNVQTLATYPNQNVMNYEPDSVNS